MITLRPITSEDEAFLYQVYAHSRDEEMALVDWDAQQKEAFLRMQHHAQHTYYTEQYPHADFQVICRNHQPIGRIYIDRRKEEIQLVDIALLPAYRNQGIGTGLLNDLLHEARQANLPVRLYVDQQGKTAKPLYERLGFYTISAQELTAYMEWIPVGTIRDLS